MSLFPAYSVGGPSTAISKPKETETSSWLTNSSYHTNALTKIADDETASGSSDTELDDRVIVDLSRAASRPVSPPASVSLEAEKTKHSKKIRRDRKRYRRDKYKFKRKYEAEVENVYFEDKCRDRGNCTVNTLCSRARPAYSSSSKTLGFRTCVLPRKQSCERYYAKNIDVIERFAQADSIIKKTKTKNEPSEEECSRVAAANVLHKAKTKEFNEKLSQNPGNIPLWIKYIHFQDTLEGLQKYQSPQDKLRALIAKKLSIVEKAIDKNPESLELLKLKLSFMGELLPADQFSNELETMISKETGNDLLWKTYIMVTQGSVAMCNVPRVLELYSKCFCTLRQKARTNPRMYDEKLLQILFWCLTFLRQTGLWEQMWETIRLNLNLNLNLPGDSLRFQKTIDEKKLISMEEVILMSRLPLNQLWQRTESLRENCHWVSVTRDELELLGDSRRFILPEDVADFVHPILTPNSNFRMAVYSLLSLKVPLLPNRDTMLKELALTGFGWAAESAEVLLPFLYPTVGEMAGEQQRRELFNGILAGRLTSGPQYILFHPAQESYLDFIREVFRTIAEALPPAQRTSIYIWWLRFERLLIFIQKEDPPRYDCKGKKLKANLKEFLKKNENRNNLNFYREYALIEREMGRLESCLNILKAAIRSSGECPFTLSDPDERAALLSLYRAYLETLLNRQVYKGEIKSEIQTVIGMMLPRQDKDPLTRVDDYLRTRVEQLLEQPPLQDKRDAFFLPNADCDTIVCCAYLLYTKNTNVDEAMSLFRDFLDHYKDCPDMRERLYEAQLALLQLECERTGETYRLNAPVKQMLDAHPDSFFGLSILAGLESEVPIWKFNCRNVDTELWRAISTCLASRRRIYLLCKADDPTNTRAAINKLLSLHRTLARSPTTKTCPLLWRLYMLLLREYNLREKKGEEVYHESVEQCPWARSIYIDAADVAPHLLTQIQDVIREKELRMHVTPEELDILRGG